MTNQQLSTNTYGTAKWIVSATASNGTHTTIATALTAASSGDTIFIRPGTYTENITLKAGVNLTAYACDASAFNSAVASNVTIVGTVTASYNGRCNISGIGFQTNSASILSVSGASTSQLQFNNCSVYASNNNAITVNSANWNVIFNGCLFYSASTYNIFTITTGFVQLFNCDLSANDSTANTIAAGAFTMYGGVLAAVFNTSSTGILLIYGVNWSITNTTLSTMAGTGTSVISNSYLLSGSSSAISVGTGTTVDLYNSSISSSNTNAITGAGTLNYGGVVFNSTSSTINTTTQTPIPWPVQQGGTAASSFTAYGPVVAASTTTGALTSIAPSATSGVPFISQGSSSQPAFGTAVVAGGGTGATTFTAGVLLANGTSAFTTQANNVTGNLVYISSQNASNSASISFTSGITSTYTTYLFILSGIVPATNEEALQMTVSSNGGTSYASSGYLSGMTGTLYNSTSVINANATSAYFVLRSLGTAEYGSCSFYVTNVTAALPTYIHGTASYYSVESTGQVLSLLGGSQSTTSIDAFKFTSASGNITSGKFTLFGVLE